MTPSPKDTPDQLLQAPASHCCAASSSQAPPPLFCHHAPSPAAVCACEQVVAGRKWQQLGLKSLFIPGCVPPAQVLQNRAPWQHG